MTKQPMRINRFPYCSEDISEWKKNQTFTLKQLMIYDRLHHETLKDIILQVEQRYNANDVPENDFEEIFKLIFTKLFDEKKSSDDADIISLEMKRYGKQIEQIDDSVFRLMTRYLIRSIIYSKKHKWSGKASSRITQD